MLSNSKCENCTEIVEIHFTSFQKNVTLNAFTFHQTNIFSAPISVKNDDTTVEICRVAYSYWLCNEMQLRFVPLAVNIVYGELELD